MTRPLAIFALCCGAAFAQQRTVAITVDDLPLAGSGDAVAVNRKLLRAFQAHHVPAIGFVNQTSVEALGAAGTQILKEWTTAGLELGNHTYSHPDFNALSVQQEEDEIVRGEASIGKPHFFRFPFNHTGDTKEKHDAIAAFLAGRGYQLATCTIDTSDYQFNSAYAADRARVRAEYLDYSAKEIDYYAGLNRLVLGYNPPEVMLLHANELNADTIDDVLKLFEARGYRFVTIAAAQSDGAYRAPDAYVTKFGPMWGYRWAALRNVKVDGRLEPEPPKWITDPGK